MGKTFSIGADTPKARQGEATRERIRLTAASMFGASGYEAVSLRDIARTADYPIGALMRYWPTKFDMYADVMGHPPVTDLAGQRMNAAIGDIIAATEIEPLSVDALNRILHHHGLKVGESF